MRTVVVPFTTLQALITFDQSVCHHSVLSELMALMALFPLGPDSLGPQTELEGSPVVGLHCVAGLLAFLVHQLEGLLLDGTVFLD